jgi:predicted secreted hydrolase
VTGVWPLVRVDVAVAGQPDLFLDVVGFDIFAPVRWRFKIPAEDIDLELKAVMPNQENLSTRSGIHYWEGAVIAHPAGSDRGQDVKGRGFVELTGYGEGSRPPV